MTPLAALTYTLITVTYGGSVAHSGGYDTLHMCEEARSLATTGMTIEAKKASDDAYKVARDKEYAEWRATHPSREPKNDSERSLVKSGIISWGGSAGGGHTCDDGKICDDPNMDGYFLGWGKVNEPGDTKVAECVIVPDQKTEQ